MANPRNVVIHDGIGYRAISLWADGSTITFSASAKDGSAVVGRAVGLVAGTQNTIELVADGQAVLGRLDKVEGDGGCTVQVEGQCYLPAGDSQTLVRDSKIVGALGASSAKGFIRSAVSPGGSYVQGTQVDAARARHSVLDIAGAPQISVMLGNS